MSTKILAFTKPNQKYPESPEEDSFRYLKQANRIIAVVADGITRDFTGIGYVPFSKNKKISKHVLSHYPIPSPAKIAADIICNRFLSYLQTKKNINEIVLRKAFEYANREIRKLNEKNIKRIDYLENDFWACVASACIIQNNTLYYGYLTDCGVSVFDSLGKIKLKTRDDMKPVSKYLDSIKIDWQDPKWRKLVRSKFRNNPDNIINGKLISYGAFTGEEAALYFLKTGKLNLQNGDCVLLYSDGLEPILKSKEFINCLLKNNFHELKDLCLKDDKHTKEGTLVAILIDKSLEENN